MWNAQVVSPENLTSEERQLWREACDSNPELHSPFYSYAFTAAVAHARPHVKVAIIERDDDIVGFWPFQFSNAVRYLLKSAERVGGDMSDHCGIVGIKDFRLTPEELLRIAGLNAYTFQDLSSIQQQFGLSGQRPTPGLRLNLLSGGDAYWRDLKRSNHGFISGIERKERQLAAKCGPIRFFANVSESDAGLELSRVIRVKGEQYRRTVGKNLFDESWRRNLLAKILGSKDAQCSAFLSTLYAGDTWLASHLGIRFKTVLHQWFPVYNADFSKSSPGHVLTKYLIRNAEHEGISFFDLGGYGDYKRQFGPETYSMSAGMWVRDGLAGWTSHVHQSLAWRFSALQSKLVRRAD